MCGTCSEGLPSLASAALGLSEHTTSCAQANTQLQRHSDRQCNRQTYIHRDRHTDTQTHRQPEDRQVESRQSTCMTMCLCWSTSASSCSLNVASRPLKRPNCASIVRPCRERERERERERATHTHTHTHTHAHTHTQVRWPHVLRLVQPIG